MAKVRFINTFNTVVPLLKQVIRRLSENGIPAEALISKAVYRSTDELGAEWTGVWVPAFLRRSKRGAALAFALAAPFHLIASPARLHIFLTQPPLFFIAGAAICRLRGLPYMIHVMDLYPELLGRLNLLRPRGLPYRLLHRAAAWALKGAAVVVVIGRCMQRRVLESGVEESRIRCIPNWASADIAAVPASCNRFLTKYGLQDRFVVLYAGNMGFGHRFDTILNAARLLRQEEDISFVFVGGGSRRKEIQQAIEEGAPNLRLIGFIEDRDLLAHLLSAASLHFISLRDGMDGIMVPSKFYSCLASGRPILYEGPPASEVALTIDEIGCGSSVLPGQIESMRKSILRWRDSPREAARAGRLALAANQGKWGADSRIGTYVKLVRRTLERTR